MPLKVGTTNIGAIYKGSTAIAKVYKGTTLLFENAVWLDYYFKNLYHSLVPETISGTSNIFDSSTRVTGKILNDSGVEVTDNNSNYFSQKIVVQPNEKLYLGFKVQRIYKYDINGAWIGRVYLDQSGVYTVPSDAYFIQIQVSVSQVDFTKMYINRGETDLGYEPYALSVKNQMKVAKIYGNGVIWNQIVENGNFTTQGDWYSSSQNVVSVNDYNQLIIAAGSITDDSELNLTNVHITPAVANHKYIMIADIRCTKSVNIRAYYSGEWQNYYSGFSIDANVWTKMRVFFQPSSSNGIVIISPTASNVITTSDSLSFSNVMLFDLTLMFGTGNEPTTTSDNRIKMLSNQGYIPYNLGEYKGTDIGEFRSVGKNLCNHTTLSAYDYSYDYCVYNPNNAVLLKPGTYTFSCVPTTPESSSDNQVYVQAFNKNNTTQQYLIDRVLSYQSGSEIIWSGLALYIKPHSIFTVLTECILTFCGKQAVGVLTQPQIEENYHATTYAPYQEDYCYLKTQLNGAINAHDIMEVTNSSIVFTKNVASVDLGSLSWSYGDDLGSGYSIFSATLPEESIYEGLDDLPNIMCKKYLTGTIRNVAYQTFEGISIYPSTKVCIQDSNFSTTSAFTTAVSGTMLYYELATPQTITIPRKYMAMVDLGSIAWEYAGANIFYATLSNAKNVSDDILGNVVCNTYLSVSRNNLTNKTICISGTDVVVKDSGYTNASVYKSAMAGVYLFYETASEVSDIATKIDIEPTGTITSDWFHYFQLVENGNFATPGNWTSPDDTLGIADKLVLTTSFEDEYGSAIHTASETLTNPYSIVMPNSKYLICFSARTTTASGGGMEVFMETREGTGHTNYCQVFASGITLTNNYQQYAVITDSTGSLAIFNPTTTVSMNFYNTYGSGQVGDKYEVKDLMIVDLSQLAFINGPVSISDARIQRIINSGYTEGKTIIDTEVLPNVDFSVKCK